MYNDLEAFPKRHNVSFPTEGFVLFLTSRISHSRPIIYNTRAKELGVIATAERLTVRERAMGNGAAAAARTARGNRGEKTRWPLRRGGCGLGGRTRPVDPLSPSSQCSHFHWARVCEAKKTGGVWAKFVRSERWDKEDTRVAGTKVFHVFRKKLLQLVIHW